MDKCEIGVSSSTWSEAAPAFVKSTESAKVDKSSIDNLDKCKNDINTGSENCNDGVDKIIGEYKNSDITEGLQELVHSSAEIKQDDDAVFSLWKKSYIMLMEISGICGCYGRLGTLEIAEFDVLRNNLAGFKDTRRKLFAYLHVEVPENAKQLMTKLDFLGECLDDKSRINKSVMKLISKMGYRMLRKEDYVYGDCLHACHQSCTSVYKILENKFHSLYNSQEEDPYFNYKDLEELDSSAVEKLCLDGKWHEEYIEWWRLGKEINHLPNAEDNFNETDAEVPLTGDLATTSKDGLEKSTGEEKNSDIQTSLVDL